ncbi:Protein FAR1-RELATED SEQUENCE 5 [Glycine soja]
MDEDQWMYEGIMPEEVDMDENEEECGVNEPHVFDSREDVLRWARSVAYENGFVAMIVRSDTNTCSRGRTSFVLIGRERSGEYRCRKKEFVRRDTGTRKCRCPFKLLGKPVVGGQGWMVKLISEIHNNELAKSLVGHPYAERLTKAEKTLIADMTKSMVKPRNILLTLKEHNANSCMTIKQIYNTRSAYRTSIRGSDTEMQHLMKLLERDQYIHWHRLKNEDVVLDIFWCHPDAVKLDNACNLVFLIDSTYKTNRYRLPLLDFDGVTPTGMTFSTGFAYLEGERLNNVVWALECFRGIFLRRDVLPGVIVTDRDLALMNAVKTVFPECTNLLYNFHINKNVKAKCKSLIGQRNAWEYVMDAWGTLVDCPSEQQFDECLKREHNNKQVESAHWALKRVLQNSLGDLCNVWDAMNNMMTLQHTEIRASFETSTHVVGHVFKKKLYKRLLGMVSGYALNQIAAEFYRVHYAGKNPSTCGCVMRTMHGHPYACELSKYVFSCIPLDSIHMFWRRLSFSDQGLSEPEVSIKEVMETISKRFEELDVCADGNYGYRSVADLLGIGEDSWSLVRTHLLIELGKFSEDYIKLFDGTDRFEDLRMSLHVDGLTKITMDKWMDIIDMGYVIASRTPDGILNILEATMTPTHDALLYYNGRWNMPRQNEFVGYSFTGKNPKKFLISSRCTMDELKDLIKQVVPHGIPPYGIHETQTLFASCDEVLHWARSVVHDIGFVVVIMRSYTNTGVATYPSAGRQGEIKKCIFS